MPYEHLRLGREEPLTDRHRRQDKRPRFKPTDPRAFGATLRDRFLVANERNAQADVGGFDTRRLIKIQLRAGETMLPPFDGIEGIEIVSQEAETVVLAFATPEGLANFERRLSTLAQAGDVTRKELLYVIEDFDRWTREDRLGAALRDQGMPAAERFLLDISCGQSISAIPALAFSTPFGNGYGSWAVRSPTSLTNHRWSCFAYGVR